MGALGVVLDPPRLNGLPRLLQRREPVAVEAFGAKVAVERLGEGVVRGLARPRELELHAVAVGPGVERLGDELRPVVDGDPLWEPNRLAPTPPPPD